MNSLAFFTRLSQLMVDNPPKAADAPVLMKLERIGLRAGQPPNWNWLERSSVALGRRIADWKVGRELERSRAEQRGWSTPPGVLGNYGTHYNIRAVVAKVGLGANLPVDAIYPFTRVDASGAALHGDHRYRLHFEAHALPPVSAFWSVTAYGSDDFLIDHPLQRFARASHDQLRYNPDGSLDLWIQAQAPAQALASNWLPVRAGAAFLLNARLYGPLPSALDGSWQMPALQRID